MANQQFINSRGGTKKGGGGSRRSFYLAPEKEEFREKKSALSATRGIKRERGPGSRVKDFRRGKKKGSLLREKKDAGPTRQKKTS